jgi:hypothetical protein
VRGTPVVRKMEEKKKIERRGRGGEREMKIVRGENVLGIRVLGDRGIGRYLINTVKGH